MTDRDNVIVGESLADIEAYVVEGDARAAWQNWAKSVGVEGTDE